ncbi:NACHT domain-containing protein [Ktedonobacter racemifer]|uniref:NACHT domain-containing protein n=1 Tax=Ktedonobacter racemifer TaxID=363277 RepID=UPI0012F74AC4|nr:NACHT domain-containing protein [Ktedonobacter racemifer]
MNHEDMVPWWLWLCRFLWKITAFLLTSVVLSLAVNVASTWLTTPKGMFPNDSPLSVLMTDWPITLLVCGGLVFLTALFWTISHRSFLEKAIAGAITLRERKHIIRRLSVRYKQIRSQSLQGAVQIELGLVERPTAIHNEALLALRLPEQADQALPLHTSIVDAYNLAQQEFLVLGEPGAGKSTLLLELAHHLIKQAEREHDHPLPVYLPLSTWATHRPPLQNWMIEQFASVYDISRNVSQRWIQAGLVLPLLDGLDEMEEAARPTCIAAINAYHRDHMSPLIVCSRTSEYDHAATQEKLMLHTAVVVQPLSRVQVDTYLTTLGKPLAALRTTLKKNPALATLATTPLMLQILILTYHGTTVRQLSHKASELQKQIWTAYVQHMVQHKGDATHYPFDRTTTWLGWLARYMQKHNLTIFSPEDLQPDALPRPSAIIYRWCARLIIGLLLGLLFGWLCGLLMEPIAGLVAGSILMGITIVGKLDNLFEPAWKKAPRSENRRHLSINHTWLLAGLVMALAIGLLLVLVFGPQIDSKNISDTVVKQASDPTVMFSDPDVRWAAWTLRDVKQNGGHIGWGWEAGLTIGGVAGLLIGLVFGWGIVIRRIILRIFLWYLRLFPWRATPFFEDATARILLRRVGGGYSFTHHLLLEYFADLDTTSSSTSPPAHPVQ